MAYTSKESIPSRILMNNLSEAVAMSEENPGPSPLSILDVLRALHTRSSPVSAKSTRIHRQKGSDELEKRDPANLKPKVHVSG